MNFCNCTSHRGGAMVGTLQPGRHWGGSPQSTGSGADVHGTILG